MGGLLVLTGVTLSDGLTSPALLLVPRDSSGAGDLRLIGKRELTLKCGLHALKWAWGAHFQGEFTGGRDIRRNVNRAGICLDRRKPIAACGSGESVSRACTGRRGCST